jgi:aryl-alcohol dehydrogenase-like predicted oxidoreductase
MQLGIGTAQFGMNYGISNTSGQPAEREIQKIIKTAKDAGIKVIDTAAAYGSSEEVLGRLLPKNGFDVITKIGDLPTLERSFVRLKRDKVYAVLAHNADYLLSPDGAKLWEGLCIAKEAGRIVKIGVSVYNSSQIDRVLDQYSIDIIQVPINVLDQRLLKTNHLQLLKKNNIEIHARSIFLQGLLLLEPENLPPRFHSVQPLLKKMHSDCERMGIHAIELALHFIKKIAEIDVAVLGLTSQKELSGLIHAVGKSLIDADYAQYAIINEELLNPSRW